MTIGARRALMVLLLIGLAGCARESSDRQLPQLETNRSPMNLELAKATSQAGEREIAALIPADQAVAITQSPKGAIMSCDESTYRWSGALDVTVGVGFVGADFLTEVTRVFQAKPGFDVEQDVSRWGSARLVVTGSSGESYVVRPSEERGIVHVSSYSTCIELQEGEGAFGEY